MRRPGAVSSAGGRGGAVCGGSHPLCRLDENAQLQAYERTVKDAFDGIVPTLKELSALQHEADFVAQAQRIARQKFGFELPDSILEGAWVEQLDMRRLFAWCVFQTYKHFCDDFFLHDPLASVDADGFDAFLQACGFHTLDISPCADGRLAHVVRYVLRLPHRSVRRKSYAGARCSISRTVSRNGSRPRCCVIARVGRTLPMPRRAISRRWCITTVRWTRNTKAVRHTVRTPGRRPRPGLTV